LSLFRYREPRGKELAIGTSPGGGGDFVKRSGERRKARVVEVFSTKLCFRRSVQFGRKVDKKHWASLLKKKLGPCEQGMRSKKIGLVNCQARGKPE